MNARINELALQVGLEFDDDVTLKPGPIYYTTQKDLEKFAELIVKECIKISQVGSITEEKIKHHFGVEE